MTKIELIHAEVLQIQLQSIPKNIRIAVERTAMRKANRLVVEHLRQNVPVETGALKKSLTTDIRNCKSGNVLIGVIGADNQFTGPGKEAGKRRRRKTGNIRRPAKYMHLVELGTQKRQTQAGQNRGSTPAVHFRDATIAATESQVQQILQDAVEQALQ
jgi:HK97 gp10 family phage protein